jgi:hypothetical protein
MTDDEVRTAAWDDDAARGARAVLAVAEGLMDTLATLPALVCPHCGGAARLLGLSVICPDDHEASLWCDDCDQYIVYRRARRRFDLYDRQHDERVVTSIILAAD